MVSVAELILVKCNLAAAELDANDDGRVQNPPRSVGPLDLGHFLTAALRLVCSLYRTLKSHGWDGIAQSGIMDRRQRLWGEMSHHRD